MIVIKRLFANRILKYHENTEKLLLLLDYIPWLGGFLENQIVLKGNDVLKHCVGVIAQLISLLWEFLKKFLFVATFVWLPYRLLANDCPLIAEKRTVTLIFLFFMVCTVCGTLVNNVVTAINKRDYIMTRVVLISPAMNFMGKLVCKMIGDLLYFTLVLLVLKLTWQQSLIMAATVAFVRPLGELFAIIMYEKFKFLYINKGAVYGSIMALVVLVCYGTLFMVRDVSDAWIVVLNPLFPIVAFVLGVIAFLILCNYRNYAKILNYEIAER